MPTYAKNQYFQAMKKSLILSDKFKMKLKWDKSKHQFMFFEPPHSLMSSLQYSTSLLAQYTRTRNTLVIWLHVFSFFLFFILLVSFVVVKNITGCMRAQYANGRTF